MKKKISYIVSLITVMVMCILPAFGAHAAENRTATPSSGVEISTEELRQMLLVGRIPVIDVRPENEFAVSHIPGSVNIFETEIERMMIICPDKTSGPVLYCNGPHCHKSARVAEKLSAKGYTNVKRYQQGLPVWRASGYTAETSLLAVKRIFSQDKTAVFVDGRSKELFKAGTLAGAVNLQSSEIEAANKDGRLPYTDHGTRVIVFGNTVQEARQLAEAIAQRAYWNSSYVAGTYEELEKSGL